MRSKISFIVAICAAMPLLAKTYDRVVAIVDDQVVTMYELKQAMKVYPYEPVKKILDNMIADMIIEKKIREANIQVSDEELSLGIRRILMQNRMTPEQLRVQVAKQGLTYDEYLKQLRKQLAKQKFINKEIGSQIKLSDMDLRDYYDAHRGQFPGSFEAERDNVFQALFDERLVSSLEAYVARMQKSSFVEIKDEALADIGR